MLSQNAAAAFRFELLRYEVCGAGLIVTENGEYNLNFAADAGQPGVTIPNEAAPARRQLRCQPSRSTFIALRDRLFFDFTDVIIKW